MAKYTAMTNITKVYRINSKLYHRLMQLGGESLVAVYVTLKTKRNRPEKYQAYRTGKNNKLRAGYTLLSKESGISLTTLKKYCPLLVEEGLLFFEGNGDVVLLGNSKEKKKYAPYNTKLVPILVSNKLSETKVYVKYVLLHSYMVYQKRGHARRTEQREILSKIQNNDSYFDQRERSIIKKLLRGNPDQDKIQVILLNCLVASNSSFYKNYNTCTGKERKNEEQFGYRLKKRLRDAGLIATKRRFEAISPNHMSFETFLQNKGRISQEIGKIVHWRRGLVCVEQTNMIEILPTTFDHSPISIQSPKKKIFPNYFKNNIISIPNKYMNDIINKREFVLRDAEKSLTR